MRPLVYFTIILFAAPLIGTGQTIDNACSLEGYWTGALVKDNSIQSLELEFFEKNDSLFSSMRIPDWAYYSPRVARVETKGRNVTLKSDYGPMTMVLDSAFGEMVGSCEFANVHFKKSLRPVRIKKEEIDLSFDVNGLTLDATLIKRADDVSGPVAIIVHGRNCGTKGYWKGNQRILADYGLAVLAFDKRGSEATGVNCEDYTIQDHAADLARIAEQLAQRDDVSSVGFITYSAGGWVAPLATSMTEQEIAFIISVAGPSTSIKQQQLDCTAYYLRDNLGLGAKEIAEGQLLVELECSPDSPEILYPQIVALIDSARANGWIDVLVETDIPKSMEDVENLWMRRNRYEPKDDLAAFKGPYLSILGGSDAVVPPKENTARFHSIFDSVGKKNYQVSILPNTGHGMEHGARQRDLLKDEISGENISYYKFDRVAAGAMDEMVRFLRMSNLIEY